MKTQHNEQPQPQLSSSIPATPAEYTRQEISPASLPSEEAAAAVPCKNTLEGLLKSPLWVIQKIETGTNLWREGGILLGWALVFHALYGFAVALFGGWDAAFMTTIKAPLIALCTLGLCLPSCYIFSCIGGIRASYAQIFTIATSLLAMIGLLLLGLAPIAWLFSISTKSLSFPVLMNVMGWLIAVGFAARFLRYMKLSQIFRNTIGLKWWMVIFIVVSFQMATTMRPLLEKPTTGWWESGKKLFIVHFLETIGEDLD
jgi:hypothetical protein